MGKWRGRYTVRGRRGGGGRLEFKVSGIEALDTRFYALYVKLTK